MKRIEYSIIKNDSFLKAFLKDISNYTVEPVSCFYRELEQKDEQKNVFYYGTVNYDLEFRLKNELFRLVSEQKILFNSLFNTNDWESFQYRNFLGLKITFHKSVPTGFEFNHYELPPQEEER